MPKDLKRSLTIQGHRTSLSLEPEFWNALQHIAAQQNVSVSSLVQNIDGNRGSRNLSSACRVFVLTSVSSPKVPGRSN
jgi:predicted DNA-binding ribbon-helix-helix protein